MCFFEVDDVCPVYNITHPRARTAKPCRACKTTIAKGEQYERHSYVAEGSARSDCLCEPCALAHQVFRRHPHHRGSPTPDWFVDALLECFEGAPKTDPDAKMWRSLYAGIRRRIVRSQRAGASA